MSLHIRVSGMRKTVILGEYDLDTKRVRLLPRFEGAVNTSIGTQRKDTRLHVGRWLSWDNERLRAALVTGAPGFAPLKNCHKQLAILPHSSLKQKLIGVSNTVTLIPLR
ncbi:hypothetical protein CMK14_28350 [Candidatus Poribacteria bacterium]|nr:hypothetical protein [Candidatus Poribacteria bacterium]